MGITTGVLMEQLIVTAKLQISVDTDSRILLDEIINYINSQKSVNEDPYIV